MYQFNFQNKQTNVKRVNTVRTFFHYAHNRYCPYGFDDVFFLYIIFINRTVIEEVLLTYRGIHVIFYITGSMY